MTALAQAAVIINSARHPRWLRARLPLFGLLWLALSASAADGQARPSCFDSIPPSALTRVVVYTHASLPAPLDQREQPLLASIDVFAQTVASTVRAQLHARSDELPTGEPALSWRTIEPSVLVFAYRDGHYRGEIARGRWSISTTGAAGAELLLRAMDSLRAGGDAFFWDSSVPGDSIAFTVAFAVPSISMGGKQTMPAVRAGFPTATLLVPSEEPVRVLERQRPYYPPTLQRTGYRGNLVVEYQVDTTGRVNEETLHDVWPGDRPRPVGSEGIAYGGFLVAVRRALLGSRFEPARVGGCPVPQLVTQPFIFSLRR